MFKTTMFRSFSFSSSGSVSTPVISTTKYNSSSIDLQCNSTGWYPEPEVFWLDGEGNLLSAGPTETVRGPDDLYTVSSRVTVEKRHSNSFTCRVQQNHINQIREANIQISGDFLSNIIFVSSSSWCLVVYNHCSVVCFVIPAVCFEATSCSAHVAVLVVFVLLVILAAACVVWKWRQNQTKGEFNWCDVNNWPQDVSGGSTIGIKALDHDFY